LIENLKLVSSFLDNSSISLKNEEKSYISSLFPPQIQLTKLFANGDYKEFKAAVENKKAVLIICKTNISFFGLLIVDPIIFNCK